MMVESLGRCLTLHEQFGCHEPETAEDVHLVELRIVADILLVEGGEERLARGSCGGQGLAAKCCALWREGHSDFAIWAPVLYDLDSCFGIENVGLIKLRYDADWDYEWKGTP